MSVIFPKWTNSIPGVVAAGVVLGLAFVIFFITYYFSPRYTDVGYAPEQPVPYSHKLHAGLLGFDCRYCHNTVEEAAFAAVPPTNTCINCHRADRVKGNSQFLALVRESAVSGDPIPWVRVHMLPDYVYFNHSVHVNAGVGCASCHGRVDEMEVVRQAEPLSMSWCLECHMGEDDGHFLRPVHEVTNMAYEHDPETSRQLAEDNDINPPIYCGACHR